MTVVEFHLPDVGEGIATADIIEWRVAAGDRVVEGQDLVEIQTDKAMVVIPSPATGVVTRLGAAAGESLAVGAVLRAGGPPRCYAGRPSPPAARRTVRATGGA
jgi:pyruvate/2-oxoglutarate dehydrogenase complex dihydrolipoamide acyltransferase (E2) component